MGDTASYDYDWKGIVYLVQCHESDWKESLIWIGTNVLGHLWSLARLEPVSKGR